MSKFDICKENWKKMLVGSPELLKDGDETVRSRIEACSNTAMNTWADFKAHKKGDETIGFFRDTPAVESNDMTREYGSLKRMALGYATYGTECYQNKELLDDLLWALEWGYNHYYGRAEIEDRGWRSVKQFNWWDWCIGTPMSLMDIILLVDEHLTLEQKKNYLALFDNRVPVPRDYGSNKVHFGELIAKCGILCENAERILVGRDGIEDTYLYADGGVNDNQGFYTDGSYVFHTLHPMNFTYGAGHFSGIIDFAFILAGSEFELKKEHTDLLYSWLYKSFFPFYRNGEIFRSVLGRHPTGARGSARGFIKDLTRLYGLSAQNKKAEIADMITMLTDEHPLSKDGYCVDIFGALTLNDYLLFKQAYKHNGATVERNGFYAFNCMDRCVQHQDDYSVALSISSSRIYNYECINHVNMTGWYHGDGALAIHSTPFKNSEAFWEGVDPYRIPGTTADDSERLVVSIAQKNEYLSSRDFVGSLTTGETGVSVMQLESFHGDGGMLSNRYYNPSGAYGGMQPARECTLTANKAYFFMNGYVVCLGSAVNSTDGTNVYTILENRHGDAVIENGKLTGYAELPVTFNGKTADIPSIDTPYEGVKYITMGTDAYCILDESALIAKKTGKTEKLPSFTQILINHGVNPVDKGYAYAIIPFADAEKAKAFVSNAPFEIVENSPAAQVIREKSTGDLYCVFHTAGSCAGVETETPMLCSVKGGKLYACDVTQKLTNVVLKVNGKEYAFDFTKTYGKAQSVEL